MPKLVNLGSLCVDNVYRVTHLAGPGETVASHGHQVFAGGKGLNQSLAAARAGARVVHVGCVGPDGELLTQTLRDAGVDTGGVRAMADQASGHAVIQVDDAGQNAIVIAGGANRCLSAADARYAMDRVAPGDWLLLQNEINDLPRVLEMAVQRRLRLAFNVAPADDRVTGYDLSAVDLLVVNGVEARALVPNAVRKGSDLDVAGWLARRYPRADVVLTAGDQGLVHVKQERASHLPAIPVRAVDETGAGDAFTGYLLAGLLSGLGFAGSLRLGAAAGALAVT
ncbi:MAG TPA: PfkB family carbohydrate kinase, partial [Pseudomonadales bacterium]